MCYRVFHKCLGRWERVTVQVVDASSDIAEDDNLSHNDESLPELATDNDELYLSI